MENLWKLEITENHVYYVDLFASIPVCEKFDNSIKRAKSAIRYKNNVLSTKDREHGDELYDDGNYTDAIIKYTSSLCFAEIGTENVALAYAKRAACFYQQALYMEALADVQLAENARVFDQLLPDFEEFRANCFTLMDSVQQQRMFIPKLSYPSHPHFPCLASVVNVHYNRQFGRHLIANSDIPQGRMIVVEKPFAVSCLEDRKVCCTCMNKVANSIPCERCVYVVFCSSDCMNRNRTHALECGTLFGVLRDVDADLSIYDRLYTKSAIQTVLNALSIFLSVENLMKFVEKALQEDPLKLPTSLHGTISRYHFFFKLSSNPIAMGRDINNAKRVYNLALELPKMRAFFNTQEKERFLMHLIAHHTRIVYSNSAVNDSGAMALCNLASLLNHSCTKNVKSYISRNTMSVETTRDVRAGQQIFLCYLPPESLQGSRAHRQRLLQGIWQFVCRCSKCESE